MKKIKKITLLFLCMLATLSLALVSGCNKDKTPSDDSSTPTESSSVEDSSVEDPANGDDDDPDADLYTRWVRIKDPTCTEDGLKERTLKADETVKDQKAIPARGHEYEDENDSDVAQGHCIRCNIEAVIPALDPNQQFINVEIECRHDMTQFQKCSCEYPGQGEQPGQDGSNAAPLFLPAGFFSIEIPSNGALWLAITPESVGQYVLYSVGDSHAKVTRYPSSDGLTCTWSAPEEGVLRENDFYSYVQSISSSPFVFCVEGNGGDIIKIAFVKIADKPWSAGDEIIQIYATEIKETVATNADGTAKDGPEGTELKEIPYASSYFYNEKDGYYYWGTKENPGSMLYVKITSSNARLLGGNKFSDIGDPGLNLAFTYGANADGDNYKYIYTDFLLKLEDTDKVCYQNYCNSDGAYPVNKELYTFLNLYVRRHNVMDEDMREYWYAECQKTLEDPTNWLWLSACYYYDNYTMGTQLHPLPVQAGTTTVTTVDLDSYFCITAADSFYTVTWTNANIAIAVGEAEAAFSGEVTLAPNTVFEVYHIEGTADVSVTLEVEKTATGGSKNDATILPSSGDISLTTVTAYNSTGEQVHYAYYSYTATETGMLTLSVSDPLPEGAIITLGGVALEEGKAEVLVNEGDVVTVYISGTTALTVDANLSVNTQE